LFPDGGEHVRSYYRVIGWDCSAWGFWRLLEGRLATGLLDAILPYILGLWVFCAGHDMLSARGAL
jgi:hypothetical protein